MADIVLYDRTGSAVTYSGVDTITTDTPTDGETATFTYGKVVDGTEIDLALADGDQAVSVPAGSLLREATIKKPETLTPEHIKKGVDVAGVVGTFAGDETEKTVELNMADGDQIVDADPDTVMTRVTVKKPETLVPENIVDGVEIGGVVGTKTMVKAPHQLLDNESGFTITDEFFDTSPLKVRDYAFYSASITSVSLSQVKTVGASAFLNCKNLLDVNIPMCESIGNSAFTFCHSLSKIEIPKCKSVGMYAFSSCDGLKEISAQECEYVGEGAFRDCTKISEISLPLCKSIVVGAFSNCSNLEKAIFDNCENIGGNVFRCCPKLSVISFPKCTYIGGALFQGSGWSSSGSPITEAIFPECKTIGAAAFKGCLQLSVISFPKCEVMYEGVFSGYNHSNYLNNYKIKEAIFPKCKSVGAYAFDGVRNLNIAYFPRLLSISSWTFNWCYSLSYAYFFDVSYIGSYALSYCTYLKSLYLLSSSMVTLASSNALYGVGIFKPTVYVPESLVSLYTANSVWSRFSSFTFSGMTDEEIETLKAEMEAKYETANLDTTV